MTSPNGKGVREQHFFSMCQIVCLPFIQFSVRLSPPKPLGGIQPSWLHHFPSWKGCGRVIIFQHVHPSVRLLSIQLSVKLSPKPTGQNSVKLATSHPLMVRVCKSNIIFLCVHLFIHLSVHYAIPT